MRPRVTLVAAITGWPALTLGSARPSALTLAAIGSVLGGLVGIAAGLVIRAEVFGVPGVDLVALAGAAGLLAAAMLLASLLPAGRAARLDPMAVLRDE